MNAYCPAPGVGPSSPADNDYTPGFAAELMLKDLRLAQQAAGDTGADTRLVQLQRRFTPILSSPRTGLAAISGHAAKV